MSVCRFCKSQNRDGTVACRVCGVTLGAPIAAPNAAKPVAPVLPGAPGVAAPSPLHKTLQQLAVERGGCLNEREAVAYILRAAKTVNGARQTGNSPAILRAHLLALDASGRVILVGRARTTDASVSEFQLARQLAVVLVELLSGANVPEQLSVPPATTLAAVNNVCSAPVQAALRAAFDGNPVSMSDWLAMLRPPQELPTPAEPTIATASPGVGMSRAQPPVQPKPRVVAAVNSAGAHQSTSEGAAPFKVGTLSPLRRIGAGEHRFMRVAFGAGGKEVWTADDNGLVQVWSTVTGSSLARLDTRFKGGGHVTALAFALSLPGQSTLAPENAELVASGHDDGRLRIWDVRANKLRKVIDAHGARVDALTFCAPGGVLLNLVSGGSDGALLLWDAIAGSRLHTIREDSHIIKVLSASPNGREVALGGDDGRVEVWSSGAERRLWSNAMHDFWVTSLTVSPNGRMLASGGYDRTTRLWATATGAELHALSAHQAAVSDLAFAPDNRVLATAGADGTARLWDAWTAQPGPVLSDVGGAVNALAWSPGGRVLATASDSALMLWRRDS